MNSERFDSRILWGGLLILLGFVFLLQNLGLFDLFGLIPETLWSVVWLGVFGVVGLGFLLGFSVRPDNWWMAIPGFTLLGLSATVASDLLWPNGALSGFLFLLSIGVGFWFVYFRQREFWWALIPGGVLTTLAIVAGLDEIVAFDTGSVFFLGLSATFALVALAPTPEGRMVWAWIPAGVLLVLAVVVAGSFASLLNLLWPLALILVGLLVLYRTWIRRPQ